MDLDFYKRLAKALAAEFGENCEVLVHDLTGGEGTCPTGRPVTVPPR